MDIRHKNIILGVCGGIAAYKSVELLRLLVQQEARVRVVMTRSAQWFVGPTTFQTLSGQPVLTDLFASEGDARIRHIAWAEGADAVVIAPATANIIGKLAGGIADDALSTFMLVVTCPVVLCPSMNTHMFQNRAVQRNLAVLKEDGYALVAPDSGQLACGTIGPGRLPDPAVILDRLRAALTPHDFSGKRVLVTAGPTWEFLDPVRFIGNPSSGKMGFALARAAEHRGAAVVLVSGPSHLPDPYGVTTVRVQTAEQMAAAVFEHADEADIIIKAAAVSDYRPTVHTDQKIKKEQDELTLSLRRNPDILRELGRRKKRQVLVGFAAETEALAENAAKKMAEKNLDVIVGNLVNLPASGFAADTNTVTLFYRDGASEPLVSMEKNALAHVLLDRILQRAVLQS